MRPGEPIFEGSQRWGRAGGRGERLSAPLVRLPLALGGKLGVDRVGERERVASAWEGSAGSDRGSGGGS